MQKTLDICVRVVIPRQHLVGGWSDTEIAMDITQQVNHMFPREINVNLVEVSEGLIIDAESTEE